MNLYSLVFHGYEEMDVHLLSHKKKFTKKQFNDLVRKVAHTEWQKIIFDSEIRVANGGDLSQKVRDQLIATEGFEDVEPTDFIFTTGDYHKIVTNDGRTNVREFKRGYTVVTI